MSACDKCSAVLEEGDRFEHAGQTLCEDCYLEAMAKPKTCDPWAVYSAKKTGDKQAELTDTQKKILHTLKEEGPLSSEQVCTLLGISEHDFQTHFATLRHLELARGFKRGDQVLFTLFEAANA